MARTRRTSLVVLVGSACLAAAAGAVVLAKAAPSTTLVSVDAAGTRGGDNSSTAASVSANGRYVAFASAAGDLVANDANGRRDVFVRDTKSGRTTLVSVRPDGTAGGNDDSETPSICANGRFVAFGSVASDLVAGDANGQRDIFVRDLRRRATVLVSAGLGAAGTGGGADGPYGVSISANGRYVAFLSAATDLVADDTNGQRDVFVRDVKRGTTVLVGVNAAGTGGGNGPSSAASISANGRYVAFASAADDLVPGDANGVQDVFVRDLRTGTTTLVSVAAAGAGGGNGFSSAPSIDPSGRFVAFESTATDLTTGDANGQRDVFVRDLRRGTTTLVSVNAAGTASGNAISYVCSISSKGRHVAFTSDASDLVPDHAGALRDVFVRDLGQATTTLVSVNGSGTGGGNNTSAVPSISANGRFVAFWSFASDLVPEDTRGHSQVYLRRLR